ncbi:response regulator transcription factor [Polaromonas sp.]|uniref:response regulator transcription factor n=1 Tax=Polaromonas sp. TaxID=1869339 RepID=UPI0032652BCD
MSILTVTLVEDDAPIREEFARMVSEDVGLKLLEAVGSCAEARRSFSFAQPDVALIDLGLPDGDGTELIAELARRSRPTSILVVTIFGDEAHVVRALRAGAHGYLLKDTPTAEFGRAIRAVSEGAAPLSPRVASYLLRSFATPTQDMQRWPLEPLTPREKDVLLAVSQGLSVPETARRLDVAPSTVAAHIKSIYGKLAVHSRVEAVNQARARGLI